MATSLHGQSTLRQLGRALTASLAVALFVAPVVTACAGAEMACNLAMTAGCEETPITGVMAVAPCHEAQSDLMECCERDAEMVATPLDDGSSRTLDAPGSVAHLAATNSPRLDKAAASSSPPRVECARYLLLQSFLL